MINFYCNIGIFENMGVVATKQHLCYETTVRAPLFQFVEITTGFHCVKWQLVVPRAGILLLKRLFLPLT